MLKSLYSRKELAERRRSAPVPVMVAGIGIIAIRILGIFLLIGELGLASLGGWIGSSAQAWDSTLVLLAALVIVCVEVRCGVAVLSGLNWGRWCYAGCQGVVTLYMMLASFCHFLPDIFHISGETPMEILRHLAAQQLPDILVLALLFLPRRSRRFFLRDWSS